MKRLIKKPPWLPPHLAAFAGSRVTLEGDQGGSIGQFRLLVHVVGFQRLSGRLPWEVFTVAAVAIAGRRLEGGWWGHHGLLDRGHVR